MNLQSWIQNVACAEKSAVVAGFDRQVLRDAIESARRFMSLFVRVRSAAVSLVWTLAFVCVSTVSAQSYAPQGTEYPVVGLLPGDQMFPDAAVTPAGGFVVWQDNVTDGDGLGISARRVDSTLSGSLSTFRVNSIGAGDQEHPRVAMLKNGGAVFVWQGGKEGYQHIFARFLSATNTFLSSTDLLVSVFSNTNTFQVDPAVAVLNNSNVVVTWSSFNQYGSNSLLDVYAKILSPTGTTISNEFLVNQFTTYNQRSSSVAALAGGGFVVTWVSEQETAQAPIIESNSVYYVSAVVPSVNIYARLYQSNGVAASGEFQADTGLGPSANPRVAGAGDGTFLVAWSGLDRAGTNGWDVYARSFSGTGTGGSIFRLNTYTAGNQYAPRLNALGSDYLAVWTSLGQDGSREGVYGQFVHSGGTTEGGEFRVNTTTIGQQMQPVVASDGASRFLAVWTSYTGLTYGFDLFAQQYINGGAVLPAMPAPYVWAPFVLNNNVYLPELTVVWAPVQGLSVASYEVYADGAPTPMATVTGTSWTMTSANGLTAGTTHTFAVDYVLTDGQRSPVSPSASGTTWAGNENWYGIPSAWMDEYFGGNIGAWPPNVNAPFVPGGPSLYQIFLSGGNPNNPSTWLEPQLAKTAEGVYLTWNTQAGAIYQVQTTTNFGTWSNLGAMRYAAGTTDSMYVGGSAAGYYRVVLMR